MLGRPATIVLSCGGNAACQLGVGPSNVFSTWWVDCSLKFGDIVTAGKGSAEGSGKGKSEGADAVAPKKNKKKETLTKAQELLHQVHTQVGLPWCCCAFCLCALTPVVLLCACDGVEYRWQ